MRTWLLVWHPCSTAARIPSNEAYLKTHTHTNATMQNIFSTIWFKLENQIQTSFQNDEWKGENTQCNSKIVFIYCVVFCKFPTTLGWFLPCSGVYPRPLLPSLGQAPLQWVAPNLTGRSGCEGPWNNDASNGPLSGGHSLIFFRRGYNLRW